MRRGIAGMMMILAGVLLAVAFEAAAADPADGSKDPVFVRWLVPGDPGDETIREYWERAKQDELSPAGLVDLGTMLFHRGYPNDALDMYQAALDRDKDLYEAWLRIGIVKHREHEYEDARYAYNKCLKLLVGHGWCNFYLGLLEEQTGHPKKALQHFEAAYRAAPALANPKVNPEVLQSRLEVAAAIRQHAQERFTAAAPMAYLEPSQVREVKARYLPTPTPTPLPPAEPAVTPTPTARAATPPRAAPSSRTGGATAPAAGAEGGATSGLVRQPPSRPSAQPTPAAPGGTTPYGVRRPADSSGIAGGAVRSVSPEASLRPWWQKLPGWILAFV
jgi:hypothetical protein